MYPELFYTVDDIARHARGHTHWFGRDTMRFFDSRLGFNVYRTANPFVSLFVSSERCGWGNHPRLYTVRSYDCRTRDVDIVGNFQGYSSSAAANRAARRLAGEIVPSLDDLQEWAIAIDEDYNFHKWRAIRRGESGFNVAALGWFELKGVTA